MKIYPNLLNESGASAYIEENDGSSCFCVINLTQKEETEISVEINQPELVNLKMFEFLNNPVTKYIIYCYDISHATSSTYINAIGTCLHLLSDTFVSSASIKDDLIIIDSDENVLKLSSEMNSVMEIYNLAVANKNEIIEALNMRNK